MSSSSDASGEIKNHVHVHGHGHTHAAGGTAHDHALLSNASPAAAPGPTLLTSSSSSTDPATASATASPSVIPTLPGGIQLVAPSSFLRRPTPVLNASAAATVGGDMTSAAGSPPPPTTTPAVYSPPPPLQQRGHARTGSHASTKQVMEQTSHMPPAPQRTTAMNVVDREQMEGLRAIRAFLRVRTSYDVLPLSFRLIVFDTALLVKKSLNTLIQNGIVSAPLWDSKTSTFAGLLTTSDYINVIQYYWQFPEQLHLIDQFTLNSLREIEKAIGAQQIETVSIHPEQPLLEACKMMVTSRARRIPLVDIDDETRRAMVVSVVTQYRILKFVAVNVKETQQLKKPLKEMRVGTYEGLATAKMSTPVMDVIHMLVKKNISSVPILDKDGAVINVFEAVDVIALIKGGIYDDLDLTVGEALLKRSDDFAGIYTCSLWDRLDTIFDTIRRSRVHRLVVIDENARLQGVLTLSDILEYVLNEGAEQDA